MEKLRLWERIKFDPNRLLSHVHGVLFADGKSVARWLSSSDLQQKRKGELDSNLDSMTL